MRRVCALVALLAAACVFTAGCGEDDFDLSDQYDKTLPNIHTERDYFKDEHGRYVYFHGVNVSGSTKLPATTDPISYVGKPFPLDEADANFQRLKSAGFNVLRLLVIWEAIEPYGSGQYDEDYLDYIQAIVEKANEYGIYVFLDMHQDFFSRHLFKWYHDEDLAFGFGGLPSQPASPSGELNNKVQGDGAPKWAVQLILFDKNLDSPEWGLPESMVSDRRNTSDVMPVDPWGINIFLSQDVNRCFATFFAGDKVYPNWYVDGENVKDYLQESYKNAWLQVVRRVADYPNVIGYDIMNEPAGLYFVFTLYALFYREVKEGGGKALPPERTEAIVDLALSDLVASGMPLETVEAVRTYLLSSDRLPDTPEKLAYAGFPIGAGDGDPHHPDIDEAINLNVSFNRNYLQPFHEYVGSAIQAEDPDAIIFVEESLGLGDGGIGGWWSEPMLRPEGIDQVAYAPHYYTDIYPILGVDPPPRDFTAEEVRYRDYTDAIEMVAAHSAYSLGNIPVILGEYGTYFNFGGIEKAMEQNYIVSTEIIDNYYEALEALMLSHTHWNYSPENTAHTGDGWNEEDFSILGPDREFRSEEAFMRPYARFTSGRPLHMHFYSDFHYYDPIPDRPIPYHEYYLEMDALETDAPTEIFVPPIQYPDGFYVYVSDGRCAYDSDNNILYWYSDDDDPQAQHHIRLRPPYEDYGDSEWDYFFDGEVARENGRRS